MGSTKVNKQGLSRNIDAATKRTIRQNSKFGCVICRTAIYTYEHFDPPFVDAKEHSAEGMCLLCPNHQGRRETELPKKEIARAYAAIRESAEVEPPKRTGFFDLYESRPIIRIGGASFVGFPSLINVDGENLLSIKNSDSDSYGPMFRISGRFLNSEGAELFRIEENEWIGSTEVWDIDIVGSRLTIREGKGAVLFDAVKDSEKNELAIHKLDMWCPPFHIVGNQRLLAVGQYSPDMATFVYFGIRGHFESGHCALFLDSTSQSVPAIGSVGIRGATASIEGTGICVARGARQGWIQQIQVVAAHGCQTIPPRKRKERREHQLFVSGVLEKRIVSYPDWEEDEYFLEGLPLESRPTSWGAIGVDERGHSVELFHIAANEEADFESLDGFVGYWADDVASQSWADKVFECVVLDELDVGGERPKVRVKRSEAGDREVVSDVLERTGRWYHPHEFVGCPIWKPDEGA